MSYTILYRAMFVKLSDGTFIPVIESGDNNVWDVDRNRRSRSWSACRWLRESEEQRKRFSLTGDEIIDLAKREIQAVVDENVGKEPAFGGAPYTKEYILSDLGYFNGVHVCGHAVTTAARFLGLVKSGLRNAVTFEEMNCGLRLSWYEKTENEETIRHCTDYANDENELAQKWAEFQERGITPWIGFGEAAGERLWDFVKARNRKERPEKATSADYYVISFYYSGKRYVQKYTTRRLLHNDSIAYAHKYSSKKVADAAASIIARRFSQIVDVQVEFVSG